MFDITQVNASLLGATAHEATERGPRVAVHSSEISGQLMTAGMAKPIVTWRVTPSHHALNPAPEGDQPELSTAEGMALIRDLAGFGVPRLLFAGCEPLRRPDLYELVAYAGGLGMATGLVVRAGLLSSPAEAALKRAGLGSISILARSFEPEGQPGNGFRAAVDACAGSEAAGLEAELRVPLTRWNFSWLDEIVHFLDRQRIRKLVFSHLVCGRRQDDLTHPQKRRALDRILDRAEDLRRRGARLEISTDENHADGIYWYLQLAKRNPPRAAALHRLLEGHGADVLGAGVGMAGIDCSGNIHPDDHWHSHTLGNTRRAAFSEVWENSPDPLLGGLRNRLPLLKGRCANCRWKPVCGGNLRVRAANLYGDPWMPDPACYLTSDEISKKVPEPTDAMAEDVLWLEQAA